MDYRKKRLGAIVNKSQMKVVRFWQWLAKVSFRKTVSLSMPVPVTIDFIHDQRQTLPHCFLSYKMLHFRFVAGTSHIDAWQWDAWEWDDKHSMRRLHMQYKTDTPPYLQSSWWFFFIIINCVVFLHVTAELAWKNWASKEMSEKLTNIEHCKGKRKHIHTCTLLSLNLWV